jgi:hypothetical protein
MIIKVLSEHLTIGMYVNQLDRGYLETPFLSHRFLIKTHNQITQLRQYCQYVYIDTEKGITPKAVPPENTPPLPE